MPGPDERLTDETRAPFPRRSGRRGRGGPQTVVIPLRKNGLVTVEMGLDIFANVEELLQAARSLFEGLEKRVTDERYMVRNLADVLLDRIRGLQVCAAYSSNLGRASRKLTEYAKENKAFQMFLTERNWTIMKMEGFLVKPIQRVLKLDLQVGSLASPHPAGPWRAADGVSGSCLLFFLRGSRLGEDRSRPWWKPPTPSTPTIGRSRRRRPWWWT